MGMDSECACECACGCFVCGLMIYAIVAFGPVILAYLDPTITIDQFNSYN